MIDVKNLKYVLFDFDDTLCIHTNHKWTEDQFRKYVQHIITFGAGHWDDCRPNEHMRIFMEECHTKGIPLGLISATSTYVAAEAKHEWVLKEYGFDLKNYCVDSPKNKLDMLIAISHALDIPRRNILFVDDYWDSITSVANAGFQACTPMEVVNHVEDIIHATTTFQLSKKLNEDVADKEK